MRQEQGKLDTAIVEARRIARRASDWLNGKERETGLAPPDVILATIQGAAENLVFMLERADHARP